MHGCQGTYTKSYRSKQVILPAQQAEGGRTCQCHQRYPGLRGCISRDQSMLQSAHTVGGVKMHRGGGDDRSCGLSGSSRKGGEPPIGERLHEEGLLPMIREGHIMGDAQLHKHGRELSLISGSQINESYISRQSNACISKQMLQERSFLVVGDRGQEISQDGEGRQGSRDRGGGLRCDGSVCPVTPIISQDMFRPRKLQTCGLQSGHSECQVAIGRRQESDQVLMRKVSFLVENLRQLAKNESSCTIKVDHRGKGGRVEDGAQP